MKTKQQNQCNLLHTVEHDECLKHLPPVYNDYERERQKLEKNNLF